MKNRLVESFYKDWENTIVEPKKIELNESNKTITLKESKYPVLSAYKLPVWKLGQKNQNGRVYPESLGEKVLKENKVTIALDTHPSDDYDPKIQDIIAIGKNPTIENTNIGKVLFAECHFVDKVIAEKVDRAIEHGYMFEQSSSGFGELNEKSEVITESYDLERYFDLLVSDSSYQVFFGKENEITQESKKEEIEKKSTTNYLEVADKTDNKEKSMLDDKKLSFEDKMIKRSIKQSMKEASIIEEPKTRLHELEEVCSYFEDVNDKSSFNDLMNEVQGLISSTKEEIYELTEKGRKLDSVIKEKEEIISSVDELKEKTVSLEESLKEKTEALTEAERKLDIAFEEMDKSKEVYLNLKALFEDKVAEANTLVDPEDYVALFEENKTLEKRSTILERRLNIFMEKLEEEKAKKKKEEEDEDEDKEDKEVKDSDKKDDKDSEDKEDKKDKKEESEDKEDDKEDKDSEEEEEKEEKKKKKESFSMKKKHESLRIETQADDIADYYEDLRKVYGEAIERFREDFENCTTLSEAQNCFFRHKPFLSETLSLRATDRRHIVDRFQEDTIKSSNARVGNRTSVELDNCKPDPDWI